ncbi:MAG: rod-binding protein [Hyphomicrobium denitrificans]|nr:rod-binding protein [Hyphomicrobium denitrificans]
MSAILRTSAADVATWTAGQTVRPAETAAASTDAATPQADPAAMKKAKEVAQQFEAVYLRQMIDASMPKDSEALFGEGTSGTMWRSMMTDTLATSLSKTGTLGIANMILKSETGRLKDK